MRRIITTQSFKSILFILFLSSVYFYNNAELKSCPSPYTEHLIYRYHPTNGCPLQYGLLYCCWWDSNNNVLRIIVKEVHQPSGTNHCFVESGDWTTFREWAIEEIVRDAIKRCAPPLPSCDPLPPPTVKVTIPSCWYYQNVLVVKYPGDDPIWMLKKISCGLSGKCETRLIVCIDYSKNPPDIIELLNDCEVIEPPFCGLNVPDLPPSGKSWEEAWLTDCFARPCCP